jgi:hypothetical protein
VTVPDPNLSPALNDAIARFPRYLVSDDVDRGNEIASTDSESLRAFADAIAPLFGEINAVLDRLDALASLTDEQQDLVVLLNDIGQAGVEAQLELEGRQRS